MQFSGSVVTYPINKPKVQILRRSWRFWACFGSISQIHHRGTRLFKHWVPWLIYLLPELFAKTPFFRHFGDFQAGCGPNQLQYTQKGICNMVACLSFHKHHVLPHFFAHACAEIKILRPKSLGFSIFLIHRKFCSEFFTQSFEHISGSIGLITLTWLTGYFPLGENAHSWCQFSSKDTTSEVEQRPVHVMAGQGRQGQWVKVA